MKIAQVCHRFYPYIGGIEKYVEEISKKLIKKGYELEVLTTDPSGKLPRESFIGDIKIKRFKSWPLTGVYYFSKHLKDYLNEMSHIYDIIHAHNYHAFPALYVAQTKSTNKLVFNAHYHGAGHTFFRNLLHKPYKFFGRKIFERSDKIICVSNYEKNLVMNNFDIEDGKVVVIPNGINLEEFKDVDKIRKNYRSILFVGRLEKYKGAQYLIEALPKLEKNIILGIVGKGTYKKGLVRLAKKLGIENRVNIYQDLSRKDLLRKYVDADLFVLLSKHEAYGISVAEALASKTPCIVANASALKEWVDDENCFGIDYPIKLDDLGKLINEVIGRKIGGVKLYDWDDTVRELNKIYEEIY